MIEEGLEGFRKKDTSLITNDVCAAVSYWKKKVLILPLLDVLSPITGGVGGGLTLRTISKKKLLMWVNSKFIKEETADVGKF